MIPSFEALVPLASFVDQSPSFYGLVVLALVVTGMLLFKRPAIDQQTVFSLVPWMVAGSALFVFANVNGYPDQLVPVVSAKGAYLSVYVLLGLAWVAMLETSVKPETEQLLPDYLGVMGLGVATVLVAFTLLHAGALPTDRLIWPVGLTVGAAVFSSVAVFLLGSVVIDVLAYASKLSVLVVFSHTLDAVARIAGMEVFQSINHSTLSWYITQFTAMTTTATPGSEAFILSWSLTYLVLKVGFAVFAVLLLAGYARDYPIRSSIGFGAVAAIGLTSAVTNLLLIVIGGAL